MSGKQTMLRVSFATNQWLQLTRSCGSRTTAFEQARTSPGSAREPPIFRGHRCRFVARPVPDLADIRVTWLGRIPSVDCIGRVMPRLSDKQHHQPQVMQHPRL